MKIKVKQNKVKINNDILNDGEYNIHKCQFEFSKEYDGLVKKAVFSNGYDDAYKVLISDDECNIPIEVLKEGALKIGVYAYETNNDELVLRYSPSPDIIHVFDGSYVKDAQNTEPITPTDKEQIEQAITNLQNDVNNKQDTLVSGENIKTINGESVLGSGNIEIDLSNYYNKQEIDQSQASQNANISKNADDIATLNNNLTNYSLITETGSQIVLNVNPSNYQMTAILKDKNGNTIYTSNVIDLPIESMIIDIDYDSATKEIVFTLQNGTTLRVSVADLVSGLVSTDELNTILASYYTKTEIDTLLSSKANSNDVYTKSEADTLLGGKVETTTYTQGQATQDANIEENASKIDWLQTLVNQMPHVSGQGTDLSLQSVLNYRLMKFLPQGNSSQESTTGKNLLDVDADLEFTRSKTLQVNIPAGTYHITNNGATASDGSNRVTIRFNTNNKTYNLSTSTDYTVTLSSTETTIYLFSHTDYPASVGVSATIKDLMLSVDGGAYEPYTGGVPAPSPSYPFPVKVVTGENSLVICNENLFNKNSITPDSYLDSDGNIITNTTWSISDYIPVIAGEDYVYRWLTAVGTAPMSCYYDKNKQFVSSFKQTTYATKITIPTGVKYVRFTIEARNTNDLNTFMFVKGATVPATYIANQTQTYQLSLDNIELNSTPDGTIRDYIYGSPNGWFKREYIGKVVLDGTESGWTLRGTDTNTYRFTNDTVIANALAKNNTSLYFCNEFQIYAGNSGIANIDDNGIALRDSLNGFTVRILKTLVTGLDNFKTWLSNHNAIEYYLLATPVDVPITDTTLISQLNNIYNNAHSYNGVTNITTTYEDGNEQMYLDIEALKNVWEVTE